MLCIRKCMQLHMYVCSHKEWQSVINDIPKYCSDCKDENGVPFDFNVIRRVQVNYGYDQLALYCKRCELPFFASVSVGCNERVRRGEVYMYNIL